MARQLFLNPMVDFQLLIMILLNVLFKHRGLLYQVFLDHLHCIFILKQRQLVDVALFAHLVETFLELRIIITTGSHLGLQITDLLQYLFPIREYLVLKLVKLVDFLVPELPDVIHELVAGEVPIK